MNQPGTRLGATGREMRVTARLRPIARPRRPGSAAAFAEMLARRTRRRRQRFFPESLTLLRTRPLPALRPLTQSVYLTLAPRIGLATSGPPAQALDGPGAPPAGGLSGSVLQPATAPADHRTARWLPPSADALHATARPGSAVRTVVQLVHVGRIDASLPPLSRRLAPGFAPVEMVTHRPRPIPPSGGSVEPRVEPPRAAPPPPAAPPPVRGLQLDAVDMKQLTDRMIEALDRRTIAGHERMHRR